MSIIEVHPSVYRITTPYEGEGLVYLYLVTGDQIALIDTGAASSPSRVLEPALAKIGMALSDVDLIINTHGHLDHAGGNFAMKQAAPGARIHIHQADAPMATDLGFEIEFHTAPLLALDLPTSFVEARAQYVTVAAGEEKVGVDADLAEGDVLDLGKGIKLRVIHLPGHTPGHVALHWESEGVLFTADAIQGQGSRPGGYPYYFDAVTYRQSLSKVGGLDCEVLCLSHAYLGGSAISDPTRQGNDARAYVQESIRVADAINVAVSEALRRKPEASKREIALDALDELVYDLPQQRLRETDMPAAAGPALYAHIEAALSGTYPE